MKCLRLLTLSFFLVFSLYPDKTSKPVFSLEDKGDGGYTLNLFKETSQKIWIGKADFVQTKYKMELCGLFIKSEHRMNGYGATLITKLKELALEKNYTHIDLTAEPYEPNLSLNLDEKKQRLNGLVSFYERLGAQKKKSINKESYSCAMKIKIEK